MLRWPILATLLLMVAFQGITQFAVSPLNQGHGMLYEAARMQEREQVRVGAFKPVLVNMAELDSVRSGETAGWSRKRYGSWVMRKVRNEHLLEIREKDFYLNGDFVFDLTFGRDLNDDQLGTAYNNTRGFQLEGAIGDHVFFTTAFYENQSIFPGYLDTIVVSRESVPGFGRYKTFENFAGNMAYDYAFATGSVGLAKDAFTFLQFGYDRQFVGHGYRSLLLSDASFPYLFLRGNLGLFKGKVQYSVTWASLHGSASDRIPLGSSNAKEDPIERKRAKFSYLSFNPSKLIEFGIFSSIVQPQWTDSSNVDPDWHYATPSGLLSYLSSDETSNRVIGVNFKVMASDILSFYGQIAGYKYPREDGFQLGLNLIDPFDWNHLSIRLEYNSADFNTRIARSQNDFGSFEFPEELGYTHNGQYLAHPFDGPFEELFFKADLRVRDFMISGTAITFFSNPQVLTPSEDRVSFINGEVAYIVNPMSLTQFTFGVTARSSDALNANRTVYAYFGIRTALIDRYSEF